MNEVEVDSKKLDKTLSQISSGLHQIGKDIINDLSKLALQEMEKNYSKSEFKSKDGMQFVIENKKDETAVIMRGPQAAYSEFGTGTKGAMNSHPLKKNFGLNPYNSGPTIRFATEEVSQKEGIPLDAPYWTYKNDDGEIEYTQGIPAQKEVYNAGQSVLKQMPSIIDKKMRGVIKK